MKNYSKQREEILEVVKKGNIHPSAEEVYNMVKKNSSTASMSTVYRNLKLLTEKNIINKISMTNGSDRYDAILEPHHHAICIKCGKVLDIKYEVNSMKLEKIVQDQTGIKPFKYNLTIEGVCNDCSLMDESNEKE